MVETIEVAKLPLAPNNPLPYLQQVKAPFTTIAAAPIRARVRSRV